ncbi:acyltransferase family protein, partial [Oharaeibacter diazotrophicus]
MPPGVASIAGGRIIPSPAAPTLASTGNVAKARDSGADIVRALAILAVVAIHAGHVVLDPATTLALATASRWAVPVFVFYGCLHLARAVARPGADPWRLAADRSKRLALPFFAYSLLYAAVLGAPGSFDLLHVATGHLGGYAWAGQYYFLVMFQLVPLVALAASRRPPPALLVAVALCGALLVAAAGPLLAISPVLGKISDRPFLWWATYGALGLLLADAGRAERFAGRIPRPLALAGFAAIPFALATADLPADRSPYLNLPVLTASVAAILLAGPAFRGLRCRPLEFLGRNTLVVFCLNPLVIVGFDRLAAAAGTTPPSGSAGLAAAAAVVAATTAACLA